MSHSTFTMNNITMSVMCDYDLQEQLEKDHQAQLAWETSEEKRVNQERKKWMRKKKTVNMHGNVQEAVRVELGDGRQVFSTDDSVMLYIDGKHAHTASNIEGLIKWIKG